MNRYTRADGPDIQLKVGEQCGDTTKATLLPARLKMSRIAMAGSKVRKCPEFLNQTIYLDITRFMSFVRHCVDCPKCLTRYLAGLQSLSQRILSYTHCRWIFRRIPTLLLLWPTTRLQSMELERGEDLCGLETSFSSCLR